ncbi:MAG: ATP-binding cassette domain-containing protein [Rhizobiales bacterium]|nr:ATP-binding cassette domain-containing protein [Hyphomicrobiales bacterium]OJY42139.1 MAG: ABC transporter ATP-binding protein [Rhizobiales bacterium 64-17]
MLSVRDLVVDIQGSPVLRGVSLEVKAGEIVCLVGRNGAGKTTTFRSIMGSRKPRGGAIEFEGVPLIGKRPYEIARMGIGFSPEESEVFGDLTVAENIAMPTWTVETGRTAEERIAEAYRVFPKLDRYRERGGQALSGGERKMVSIARALTLDPKLLLLDEPTEGLSPAIVPSIVEGLAAIRNFGHSIFISESNVHHVPEFTDRLYVMERGEIIFAGSPHDAYRDPAVVRVIEGTGGMRAGGTAANVAGTRL